MYRTNTNPSLNQHQGRMSCFKEMNLQARKVHPYKLQNFKTKVYLLLNKPCLNCITHFPISSDSIDTVEVVLVAHSLGTWTTVSFWKTKQPSASICSFNRWPHSAILREHLFLVCSPLFLCSDIDNNPFLLLLVSQGPLSLCPHWNSNFSSSLLLLLCVPDPS